MRIADAAAGAWIPGRGPDPDALARTRAAAPRPAAAMGEAWVMGETRRMFPELLGDLARLDTRALEEPLVEIASGMHSFGPVDGSWVPWFHHLLAQLVPRALDDHGRLLPLLVNGVIACHPRAESDERYEGFTDDVLATLGRSLMTGPPWRDATDPLGWVREARRRHDHWHDVEGTFAASAFLHLVYLPTAQVPAWVASMLDIPDPVWRGQVLPWLVGVHPMLDGDVRWPKEWVGGFEPCVDWDWSHVLSGDTTGDHTPGRARPAPALRGANGAVVIETVRRRMNYDRLCAWLDSFKPYPSLADNLFDVPERFTRLYLD
jgi:hypothetical protein